MVPPIQSARMVAIPDELRTLFTQTVERRGDRYVVEIPADAVTDDTLTPGAVYRVALLADQPAAGSETTPDDQAVSPSPPVTEGEHRTVTIDDLGDEGDGIATVKRGYVVIVPGGTPGETVPVEITRVTHTVAFATRLTEPVGDDTESDDRESADPSSTDEAIDEFI
jgi:predicted RNA-binding protein with TRAM domain